jgi:murein DD-endopeptidase MepM/ murein hydrolase activator NlpD
MVGRGDGAVPSAAGRVALLLLLLVALGTAGCEVASRGKVAPKRPLQAPHDDGPFSWPADGTLSSPFGPRGNARHDGIDIAAPEGTPVRAAADGIVIYIGVLRGYGKVVIVEHDASLSTVYAHIKSNSVVMGARVHRGAVIASVGQTGKTTGPNLHFEVRRNKVARNPLLYLPERGTSLVAQQSRRRVGG